MGRHETCADDRLPIADGGVDGGNGKNSLLEEALREGKGLGLASNQDRHNWALGRTDLKSDRLESLVHLARVTPKHLDTLGFSLHDLECLEDTANDRGCKRCRKDETTGLVLHEFDQLTGTRDESAHGTERFRKGSHDDLDVIINPEVMDNTATLGADHTQRVSFVDIHDGPVFLSGLHHGRQVSHITRHAEDTIHDNEASRVLRDTLEAIAERLHGVVAVGNQLSGSNLASLDDRGVILPVAENDVLILCQGRKRPLIGKETGGEEQCALPSKKRGQRLLEFVVERDCSIQQPGTSATGTKFSGRFTSGLDDPGILSQAEVVVRPDHDLLLTITDHMISITLLNAAEVGVESLRPGIC